jgi:putative DNA-invertase from lambdoid prophage Rac
MAYAVGQTIEVCLDFDLPIAQGVRLVVATFANERGDVVALTDEPAEESWCFLQRPTQTALQGQASQPGFYELKGLRVTHMWGVTHVDPPEIGFEVVWVFKETLSGIRKSKGKQPVERRQVMELAQRRGIDAVLVTEMTRWGRSTQDLMDTLGQLASWDVSLVTQTGLTFDLSTPQGKLIANLMASLAEFEHDLLRERVRSGVAAAKARGQRFGRRPGYRPSDRQAPEVIRLSEIEKLSQREIAKRLGLSKTTVNKILKRRREQTPGSGPSGS